MSNNTFDGMAFVSDKIILKKHLINIKYLKFQETIDLSKSSSDLLNSQTSPIPAILSPKSNESDLSSQHAKNRRKKKPKKVEPTVGINFLETATDSSPASPLNLDLSLSVANETKFDSDGCETIDKIAMMVSNITQSALPLNLSQQATKPSSANASDVENKLEQLFSETKKPEPTVIDITLDSPEKPIEAPKVKKPRRKKPAEGNQKRQPKKLAANDTKGKGKGDKLSKAKGADKKDKSLDIKKPKVKENGKSKVKIDAAPFLQIQRDGSFSIINQTANGDDDAEKASSKPKKIPNEKHKQIRGLHVSTLSNKYDADKRDTSWVCVFCKQEPHKFKLGDLFGPYIISKTSKEYSLCLEDPANDIFRQGNSNKFVPIAPHITSPTPTKKKRKNSEGSPRKLTSPLPIVSNELSPDVFVGMTKIDDDHFEIWFHEDCLAWAPGTYIIGNKINGLEAAVWQSTRHSCTTCTKNGAMIACLQRGCKKESHFVCAKKNWKLCEDFKTFCELHCADK